MKIKSLFCLFAQVIFEMLPKHISLGSSFQNEADLYQLINEKKLIQQKKNPKYRV